MLMKLQDTYLVITDPEHSYYTDTGGNWRHQSQVHYLRISTLIDCGINILKFIEIVSTSLLIQPYKVFLSLKIFYVTSRFFLSFSLHTFVGL